jgi:tripeptidyl-peptidase-1
MKFAATAALLATLASTASATHVQMETGITSFSAKNWKQGSRVVESDDVELFVVLKHEKNRIKDLDAKLMDVSNPKSDAYGKHLSIDEVRSVLALPMHHTTTVVDHITTNYDVKESTVNKYGDIVKITMSASSAERLLRTKLFHHTHANGADLIRSTRPYHLPEEVASLVSIVEGVTRFPKMDGKATAPAAKNPAFRGTAAGGDDEFNSCGNKCSGFTTPAVLQAAYGYPTLNPADVASGNRMAVVEFQNQQYDVADMNAFTDACGLENPVEVTSLVGTNDESVCSLPGFTSSCIESLLDIEYIAAVGGAIPLEVYRSATFSLYDWAVQVNDDANPAWIQSVSYGNDEIQQISTDYMETTNTEFMKAGARGVSVIFASGDQGVWGRSGTTGGVFHPDFPGGSPYVTAVGGTDFATKSVIGEETSWNDSGGGFSNEFAIPDWQAEAVAAYKATATLPDSKLYNDSGRGYPDVSALGGQVNSYCIAIGGSGSKFGGVAGTSASAPVVAGVFAILNNERINAGGAPMGFLNPFIYANPDAFNDVTSGDNSAGESAGFEAVAGWDPVTGHGTPNYAKLSAAAAV